MYEQGLGAYRACVAIISWYTRPARPSLSFRLLLARDSVAVAVVEVAGGGRSFILCDSVLLVVLLAMVHEIVSLGGGLIVRCDGRTASDS